MEKQKGSDVIKTMQSGLRTLALAASLAAVGILGQAAAQECGTLNVTADDFHVKEYEDDVGETLISDKGKTVLNEVKYETVQEFLLSKYIEICGQENLPKEMRDVVNFTFLATGFSAEEAVELANTLAPEAIANAQKYYTNPERRNEGDSPIYYLVSEALKRTVRKVEETRDYYYEDFTTERKEYIINAARINIKTELEAERQYYERMSNGQEFGPGNWNRGHLTVSDPDARAMEEQFHKTHVPVYGPDNGDPRGRSIIRYVKKETKEQEQKRERSSFLNKVFSKKKDAGIMK